LSGARAFDAPDRRDAGQRNTVLGAPGLEQHVELGLAEVGVEGAQAADFAHQAGVGLGHPALSWSAGLRCQGSRVVALGFEGGLPAVEGAARDAKGVTGRRQAVLVEDLNPCSLHPKLNTTR